MNSHTLHLATTLGQLLQAKGATVTVAESCTGGGLGAAITAVPGSSAWFEAGFITYSNASKQSILQVQPQLLQRFGAVSREVVEAMAAGALAQVGAQYAVAISGIAGPDGGSADKPIGTVWFGWRSSAGVALGEKRHFSGGREAVREQAVAHALEGLVALIQREIEPQAEPNPRSK